SFAFAQPYGNFPTTLNTEQIHLTPDKWAQHLVYEEIDLSASLIFPANNGENPRWGGYLDWTDCEGSLGYDIYLWRDGMPKPTYTHRTMLPASEWTPPAGWTGDAYWWQVVAHYANGISAAGSEWYFTTIEDTGMPEVPRLVYPRYDSDSPRSGGYLDWEECDGAETYDLYLWRADTSKPTYAHLAGLTQTEWTPLNGWIGDAYCWQIVAHNSLGSTPGPEWQFSVVGDAGLPEVPKLIFPDHNALQPAGGGYLDWADCALAETYDLYLWRSGRPKPSYAHRVDLRISQWTPPINWPGDAYCWQIVAKNDTGETAGPEWAFTVIDDAGFPAVPKLVYPDQGVQPRNGGYLNWTTCAGATSYDLYLWHTDWTQPTTPHRSGLTETFWTPTIGRWSGDAYRWQIVARNVLGTTTGPAWTFTVIEDTGLPTVPRVISPEFGAQQPETSGILDWTDCAGATSYEFYLWRTNMTKPSYTHRSGLGQSTWGPPPVGWTGEAYFWQPVARNALGTSEGPISIFSVIPESTVRTRTPAEQKSPAAVRDWTLY
ncbi:hypothetical protein HQ520_03290, partial [bacterium]|nr:hypothetical protein [bacterium]